MGDIDCLASSVIRLIDDVSLRFKLGNNGRKKVKKIGYQYWN